MEQLQVPRIIVSDGLLNWLLEESEPSVRYQTLLGLVGEDAHSARSQKTKELIGESGWAAQYFARQKEGTYWDNSSSCYVPKFSSCSWRLIVLADLGVPGEDRRVKNCVEHYLLVHNVETGGFSIREKQPPRDAKEWPFLPHVCATGNMVRTLARFGFAGDDRVVKAAEWLVGKQLPDGGWNCAPQGKHGSFTATVQPIWGLSEMLAHQKRAEWREAVEKGDEFLLRHRVYKSDKDDSAVLFDFLKLHYPMHYMYDCLHGLRILTESGVKDDLRMNDAVRVLMAKRLPDGRWPLEAVYRGWRHSHAMHGLETVGRPEERELITEGWGTERAIQLEEAGKPSKWITLQALLVLKRRGLLSLAEP